MLLTPDPANNCFGCGGRNARGMQLTFEQDQAARRVHGRFSLTSDYQGAAGYIHGGIIATLLDEVMSKVNRFRSARAVTAELNVEYLRPIQVGQDFVVEGWETGAQGRNLFLQGEIRDLSGKVLARGKGRFVNLSAARDPHAD